MKRIAMIAALLLMATWAHGQKSGVIGRWTEPTGATIVIEPCGDAVSAKLIGLSKQAPARTDIHNPDTALRQRSLCGLQIGHGFHLIDSTHADGGQLYDPKSGKTYSGLMVSEGDSLRLRGYVGLKIFGRSETWTRATGGIPACLP